MAKQNFNLQKDANLLSGKERACLLIRNELEKTFSKNKKGFLSHEEIEQLRTMPDYKASAEYRAYWTLYQKVPFVMGATTEAYLYFKYQYEILKKAHLLLNLSAGIELAQGFLDSCIGQRIKTQEEYNQIKDEDMKELGEIADYYLVIDGNTKDPRVCKDKDSEDIPLRKELKAVLSLLEQTQVIKSDFKPFLSDKIAFKESLDYVKRAVVKTYNHACFFISMRAVIDKLNEDFGFDVFLGRAYSETLAEYLKEMRACINEHNKVIREATKNWARRFKQRPEYRELKDIDDYLIPEPTHETPIYDKWLNDLYGNLTDE